MKYIDSEKLKAEIEKLSFNNCEEFGNGKDLNESFGSCDAYKKVLSIIASLQQDHIADVSKKVEPQEVSVECSVRVYPTLDNKPRPWVALCRHGIGCNSIRDIPELETFGFKDYDTAIVTIKKK